jgi:hypothetical protein
LGLFAWVGIDWPPITIDGCRVGVLLFLIIHCLFLCGCLAVKTAPGGFATKLACAD